MTILYQDDDGQQVTTNSMIKSFHRCPKQAQYKYLDRLKPRVLSRPLERGTWMHTLLEFYYKGEDWVDKHKQLSDQFYHLFDEEMEDLGNLPEECNRLMRSYLWHYGANQDDPMHGWKILETEYTIEAAFPDGSLYRGRTDLLVEDEYGIWIVDHKTHQRLPDLNYRLKDMQSALYLWALRENGIKVQGFIWNYIRTVAPTKPEVLADGSRLSRRRIDTDYPTAVRAIREYGLNPEDYRPWLLQLKHQRWNRDSVQTSSFFRRDILAKDDSVLDKVAKEAFHAKKRMDEYDWSDRDAIERVPDRSCSWCPFRELCAAELFGNGDHLRRKQFTSDNDPLDYYNR